MLTSMRCSPSSLPSHPMLPRLRVRIMERELAVIVLLHQRRWLAAYMRLPQDLPTMTVSSSNALISDFCCCDIVACVESGW